MHLLVLSDRGGSMLLPALEYLDHEVTWRPLDPVALVAASERDLLVVDATTQLREATTVCRQAALTDPDRPLLVVVTEAQLAALKASWGFDDWVLSSASPAEVETRLRVAADAARRGRGRQINSVGELVIDEESYQVHVGGRRLDLTFKEFELLKALAESPNRVFTRDVLLSEVWGYDYYGGSRTIDVHVRRLRAKLGAEHDSMIQTVRGVGYKLVPSGRREKPDD